MKPTRETERLTKAALKELPKDGSFVEIAGEDLEALGQWLTPGPSQAWKSRDYVVQLYLGTQAARLSVQRTGATWGIRPQNRDQRPISWEEIQAIKAALGAGDRWAVEVYPPEKHKVNVADMRHVWFVDELAFAWKNNDDEEEGK